MPIENKEENKEENEEKNEKEIKKYIPYKCYIEDLEGERVSSYTKESFEKLVRTVGKKLNTNMWECDNQKLDNNGNIDVNMKELLTKKEISLETKFDKSKTVLIFPNTKEHLLSDNKAYVKSKSFCKLQKGKKSHMKYNLPDTSKYYSNDYVIVDVLYGKKAKESQFIIYIPKDEEKAIY